QGRTRAQTRTSQASTQAREGPDQPAFRNASAARRASRAMVCSQPGRRRAFPSEVVSVVETTTVAVASTTEVVAAHVLATEVIASILARAGGGERRHQPAKGRLAAVRAHRV